MYKLSRINVEEDLYIISTIVCVAEVLKLFFSLFLMFTQEKSWEAMMKFFYKSIVKNPLDTLNVGVSAISYVIMTNLMCISGTHLNVITYQIITQLRIPAAVIFSILLLRTSFRKLQYFSLMLLMAGVIIVQLKDVEEDFVKQRIDSLSERKFLTPNRTFGIVTGLLGCMASGFAGVYFEKIIKSTNDSVWAKNVQLSLLSLPPALIQSFVLDWNEIRCKGFFHGYNHIVWMVIFLQAFGGLITALSMKLAGNVSKSYATAASIVVSGISSTFIFHYKLNVLFISGAALVIISMPFYAYSNKKTKIEPVKMDIEGQECYI